MPKAVDKCIASKCSMPFGSDAPSCCPQALSPIGTFREMNYIVRHFKWVMFASGLITFTTFYGLFAPQVILESMFGASFSGPLENVIVRSWSGLIGLMGAVLIYGAFNETHRVFSISVVACSKAIFVSLVFLYGQDFLGSVAPAIAMDCVVVVLAGIYLTAVRMQRTPA